MLKPLEKHVATSAQFEINFADRLPAGVSLSSGPQVSVKSASHGGVSELVVSGVSLSGNKVLATLTGGKALKRINDRRYETIYCLQADAVTNAGGTESDVVDLVVYDCVPGS